jgi:hypothetical protein
VKNASAFELRSGLDGARSVFHKCQERFIVRFQVFIDFWAAPLKTIDFPPARSKQKAGRSST